MTWSKYFTIFDSKSGEDGGAKNCRLLALLLPSKGRIVDLFLTILFTPLNGPDGLKVRFFIVANYNSIQLYFLNFLFSRRAIFIDERTLEMRGVNGAYNHAFDAAKRCGSRWVALWADDLLPEKTTWLFELNRYLLEKDFSFGIFSSDEGNHHGYFGWNIMAGYPCAHFFIASIESLPGHLLNPNFVGFVGDNEIAINRIKNKVPIKLLPIKVIHQPTVNATRLSRSKLLRSDLDKLYLLHPELLGRLDEIIINGNANDENFKLLSDKGFDVAFSKDIETETLEEVIHRLKLHELSLKFRLIYSLRKLWNRLVRLPAIVNNRIAQKNRNY
jgi:hypothetical protein